LLTDLKAILHSKRANIYYLEQCRVMQKDGRVLYLKEAKKSNFYYNIPITNATVHRYTFGNRNFHYTSGSAHVGSGRCNDRVLRWRRHTAF